VGPGREAAGNVMTEAELSKQTRLVIETFMIDFLMPAITTGVAAVGLVDDVGHGKPGYTIGEAPEPLVVAGELIVAAFPDVYEELKNGKYDVALYKAMEHMAGTVAKESTKLILD